MDATTVAMDLAKDIFEVTANRAGRILDVRLRCGIEVTCHAASVDRHGCGDACGSHRLARRWEAMVVARRDAGQRLVSVDSVCSPRIQSPGSLSNSLLDGPKTPITRMTPIMQAVMRPKAPFAPNSRKKNAMRNPDDMAPSRLDE